MLPPTCPSNMSYEIFITPAHPYAWVDRKAQLMKFMLDPLPWVLMNLNGPRLGWPKHPIYFWVLQKNYFLFDAASRHYGSLHV